VSYSFSPLVINTRRLLHMDEKAGLGQDSTALHGTRRKRHGIYREVNSSTKSIRGSDRSRFGLFSNLRRYGSSSHSWRAGRPLVTKTRWTEIKRVLLTFTFGLNYPAIRETQPKKSFVRWFLLVSLDLLDFLERKSRNWSILISLTWIRFAG